MSTESGHVQEHNHVSSSASFSISDTDPCYCADRQQLRAGCCSKNHMLKICFELVSVSAVTTYHIKFQVWCGRHMLRPTTVFVFHPGLACNACKLASKEAVNKTARSTSIPTVLPGQLFTTQPAVLCESRRCSGT